MLTLILFIIILGAIVLVHEFGHFIFAKISGTYVYEFSIGMGPKIFSKKGKETEYCIRAIPIGGFVSLAGEDVIEDEKIPKDRRMDNKNFIQRFLILFFGAGNNFIFAFLLLLISALIFGSISPKPIVGEVLKDYPAYESGLRQGDLLLAIDDDKVVSWETAMLTLQLSEGKTLKFKVEDKSGNIKEFNITPVKEKVDGKDTYKYGFSTSGEKQTGIIPSIKYAFTKTGSLFAVMWDTLKYLFVGKVGVNDFSGPVGIYNIVGQQASQGVESVLYLIAFLSVNVGVINLLPFPAFDGGRILFLIIEKIFKKPIPKRIEGIINSIGFFLLILLMIYITGHDIFNIVKK